MWANLMGKPLFHSNKMTVIPVTQLLFVECLSVWKNVGMAMMCKWNRRDVINIMTSKLDGTEEEGGGRGGRE